MIPKIIHYCWFGGNPLPKMARKCIESWKKYLPDYIIKEWNEDNFNINIITYTREAYCAKKYAFVSDYARFKIIYEEGGIYMDTDVEALKSLDELLLNKSFTGFEVATRVNPGLILGAKAKNLLMKEFLDKYENKRFILPDGLYNYETVVMHMTNILLGKGLILNGQFQNISGLAIYPPEYFSPKSFETEKINLMPNTYTIHHFAGSWIPWHQKIEKKIWNLCNLPNQRILSRLISKIKRLLRKMI